MIKILATLNVLVSVSLCAQVYPGTPYRPILSDQEAKFFTKAAYLQGWTPPTISTPTTASYTVGGGPNASNYKTVQDAVAAAINDGQKEKFPTRKYIRINEGTYKQLVYIPFTEVPITLYGTGKYPSSTVITFTLSASTTGLAYKQQVGGLFKSQYPGSAMFQECAGRAFIGTDCSSIVWAKANNVQIVNLTIRNLSKRRGTDQAVALLTEGDQTQVANCIISSHQDTFWSGATGKTLTRSHVTNTFIEGDVEFVCGGGSTVFEGCTFYVKSDRSSSAAIFAPATIAARKYGYLVVGSRITGDKSWFNSKSVNLARAWDFGVLFAKDYIVGTSANGQLVLRESLIDDIIPVDKPYMWISTCDRPYAGNANRSRNLNDHRYNRFWEHANKGRGA